MTSGHLVYEDRSPVMLTVSGTRDVAVISGVAHDPSVIFLCRSIVNGDAFARYPALIVDLRQLGSLSPEAEQELDAARQTCLSRHEWLGVVRPGESTRAALVRARLWLRLVDGQVSRSRLRFQAAAGLLRGLAGLLPAAWSPADSNSSTEPRQTTPGPVH